jgi:hypothetical protein
MPNVFFCSISTAGLLPRVMPETLDIFNRRRQIRGGYLAKGFTRLGSYLKSTRPSR